MELEIAFGLRKQIRMEEQDRVSQTSSMVTVSSTTTYRVNPKLQTFGKRSRSLKRDPNCAVVMRGWLYKRDSTGLKLWKRRWFVLSNFCLYYYKDSREDCILGSLPLPSYKVFFCSPRECKNRKYAFKVVHQGMRSYLLSAETQEDMLGWVRALSQSACMENNDFMNRRCSSYQDFSQMKCSTESITPTQLDYGMTHSHMYMTQMEPNHQMGGNLEMSNQRGRATHSTDSRTRSVSLDRAAEDRFLNSFLTQTPYPSPHQDHYESFSHRTGGRVDLQHPDSTLKASTPVVQPSPTSIRWISQGERDTLAALQSDIDVVLTWLCGCDKLLQSLSLQLELLLQDKEQAQFELDMTHLQLDDWQLDEPEASQKVFLQEDLITIRARMCDVSLEMEKVWLDYQRMESELWVFRSHLQHICHFGLPQERCVAQKQIWMMDDILSGLKPNRIRFKALMGLHIPTTFPAIVHNSSCLPSESLHYSGEESEPPARPPLPAELQSTNLKTAMEPEWEEPCHTSVCSSTPSLHLKSTCRQSSPHTPESESDVAVQIRKFDQKKSSYKKNHQKSSADKLHPQSTPVSVMQVLRVELPLALTAQRVCVEEAKPKEDPSSEEELYREDPEKKANTPCKPEESQDPDNVDLKSLQVLTQGESDPSNSSENQETKVKLVEHFKERVPKRQSDCIHPLKLIQAKMTQSGAACTEESHIHGSQSLKPHPIKGKIRRHAAEGPPVKSDIKPASTSHISTIAINTAARESNDMASLTKQDSTNQKAVWFLSTSQWQEYIPLNIQEEDLLPTTQDAELSTNQELSTDGIQPTPPESHMTCHSDQSGTTRINEGINYRSPKSTSNDDGSAVGGATSDNADALSLTNQDPVTGDESQEVAETEETGSDVKNSARTQRQLYGCLTTHCLTNQSAGFLKPRVTVMSTSL